MNLAMTQNGCRVSFVFFGVRAGVHVSLDRFLPPSMEFFLLQQTPFPSLVLVISLYCEQLWGFAVNGWQLCKKTSVY